MKRIIIVLPVLVVLGGIWMLLQAESEKRRTERAKAAEQKAAVASKVDRLPEPSGQQQKQVSSVAKEAFSNPAAFDEAGAESTEAAVDGLVEVPDEVGPAREAEARELLPVLSDKKGEQPQESARPNAGYFMDPYFQKRDAERINPADAEYQKQVDELMEMRQQRLKRSAERAEQ